MNPPAAKPQPLGELIARLTALHPKRIDLSLDRMHRLLARLDHPEALLPPVIHVAGTNGKGSTIAYLRAILEAAGLRVHVYTSPYLVRINECFRIGEKGGGRLADDAELRRVLEHCEQVNAGDPITIFEMETAAAFCLFAEHEADVVLLETGLGGRLDATNVIERPIAVVIAPVSMDHTEFLGNSLTAIAGEKAAIIKRGSPVIHVAGTNGKGSTIAYLRAILEAAGLRVHVYTSPYLVRINECFRIGEKGGGRLVSDAELRRVLEHCEQLNAAEPITIFEMETAAAFCLFAEHEADVVLLETGLGGRLDATNVIDRPIAVVITPVSMDHMEFLGGTLTAIAGEKAAIIKHGAPVICAEQAPEAMSVIEAQAKRMRAPLHAAGQQWHVGVERGRLVYQDERGLMDLAAPKLFGRHQFDNAGLAIATLRAIEAFKIGMPAFETGIVGAEWPARMQRLVAGALVDQGPKGCEIWLDGGHNAEGGRVAAAALGDLEERVSRPLVVIAGMMANKDAGAFLANFAGLTRHIVSVPIPGRDNAMPPDRLADAARALGMRVENAASVEAALHALSRLAYEVPPRILISGSLYLAGHVLDINGTPPA